MLEDYKALPIDDPVLAKLNEFVAPRKAPMPDEWYKEDQSLGCRCEARPSDDGRAGLGKPAARGFFLRGIKFSGAALQKGGSQKP
jgi:hypothetical protein